MVVILIGSNFCRSLYSDRDIYLLDDPFSAVDVQLAQHINKHCLHEYLANKCVIIITHQLQFISSTDKVLMLSHGQQVAFSTLQNLVVSNEKFSIFYEDFLKISKNDQSGLRTIKQNGILATNIPRKLVKPNMKKFDFQNHKFDSHKQKNTLVTCLKSLNVNLYHKYFLLGSSRFGCFSLVLLAAVLPQLLVYACDHWLTLWNGETGLSSAQYLMVYTGIVFAIAISSIFRAFTFYTMCFNASERVHNSMVAKVMNAPIQYFDYVSVGKLLNYFTRDVGVLDESLPSVLFELNLVSF